MHSVFTNFSLVLLATLPFNSDLGVYDGNLGMMARCGLLPVRCEDKKNSFFLFYTAVIYIGSIRIFWMIFFLTKH